MRSLLFKQGARRRWPWLKKVASQKVDEEGQSAATGAATASSGVSGQGNPPLDEC